MTYDCLGMIPIDSQLWANDDSKANSDNLPLSDPFFPLVKVGDWMGTCTPWSERNLRVRFTRLPALVVLCLEVLSLCFLVHVQWLLYTCLSFSYDVFRLSVRFRPHFFPGLQPHQGFQETLTNPQEQVRNWFCPNMDPLNSKELKSHSSRIFFL